MNFVTLRSATAANNDLLACLTLIPLPLSNAALQLSTDRLVFQSPGSGQEFAADKVIGETVKNYRCSVLAAPPMFPFQLPSTRIARPQPVGIRAS
jgi:hypothetical protein